MHRCANQGHGHAAGLRATVVLLSAEQFKPFLGGGKTQNFLDFLGALPTNAGHWRFDV
jgi:hypothetical protein